MAGAIFQALLAGGPQPARAVFIGSNYGATTTYTNEPIGAASPDRIVVAIITGVSPSTLTIGGVSATRRANNIVSLSIWTASVPTGTTATIVCNQTCNLQGVYALYGVLSETPIDTATIANSGSHSTTVDVYKRGVALAGFQSNNGSSTTWTGLTKDQDHGSPVLSVASQAFDTDQTGRTIDCTPSAGGIFQMVVASWQPAS